MTSTVSLAGKKKNKSHFHQTTSCCKVRPGRRQARNNKGSSQRGRGRHTKKGANEEDVKRDRAVWKSLLVAAAASELQEKTLAHYRRRQQLKHSSSSHV